MKGILKIITSSVVCLALLIPVGGALGGASPPPNPSGEGITGVWQGTIKVNEQTELRVVFKISRKTDGTLTATMDSPDQGATNIPVEEVGLDDGNLRMEVRSVMGVFEGKIGPATIEGVWKQSGMTLPLVLKHLEEPPKVSRPQEPKKPYPYDEEEVVYKNERAGVKLAGTLTLPRGKGPFPAVLLITGSGAEDRNETVFGHHPFLVLADYLTRRGIAVLRVDDRGVGGSTGSVSQSTSEDFAGDVLAGVRFLKGRKGINPKQIGLIGHSEGGIIAPLAAVQSPDVAYIVLMAGPGISGEKILYLQNSLIGKAQGISDEEIAKNHRLQERIFAVVKGEKDSTIAKNKLRKLLENELSKEGEKGADNEAYIKSETRRVLSPWFRYFLTYDPKPTLMKVKCPVLAINGEKDLQVPPQENLRAIGEALKAGGNKDYTVKELPGLNHLFQRCKTGSPTEYAKIEETISPTALKTIAQWILKQTQGR